MLSLICPLQRLCRIRLSPSHLKRSSPHGSTSTSGIPTIFMASLRWSGIIHREVGNRPMEGVTLSNIGETYQAQGTTLNNIGGVYQALGQYDQALQNYQQAL